MNITSRFAGRVAFICLWLCVTVTMMLGNYGIPAGLLSLPGVVYEMSEDGQVTLLDLSCTQIVDADLVKLAEFDHLVTLKMPWSMTDEGLKWMGELPRLETADLSGTQVGDGFARSLVHSKVLKTLDLSGTRVTGKSLSEITSQSLTTLLLGFTQLDNAGVREISHLKSLRILDISNTEVTDEGLTALIKCKNITHLNLSDLKITAEGLKAISQLEQLEQLDLSFCEDITDEALQSIGQLKNLKTLSLAGNRKITGEGLVHLRGLEHLTSLSLKNCTAFTDAAAVHLPHLKRLQHLDLDGIGGLIFSPSFGDEGMRSVGQCKNLTRLDLSGLPVSDHGLRSIRGLMLQELTISGTRITEESLDVIAGFPAMRKLWFNFDSRKPIDISPLVNLTELESLAIPGLTVMPSGFAVIGTLNKLEHLNLTETGIDDEGLQHIADLRLLKSIDLTGTKVTDSGLKVFENFPQLESLHFQRTKINGSGLKHLAKCPCLKTLVISGNLGEQEPPLTHLKALELLTSLHRLELINAVQNPGDLSNLRLGNSLKELDLSLTPHLSDTSLEFLNECENLSALDISWAEGVTDKSLATLQSLRTLQRLIAKGTGLSDEGLSELIKELPNCKIFSEGPFP